MGGFAFSRRHAKTQAECLDYLCGWAIEMRRAGLDFSANPFTAPGAAGKIEAWVMDSASLARGADQRLPMRRHPNEPFTKAQLETLGVLQWKLDADKYETDPVLAQIRKDRGYTCESAGHPPPSKNKKKLSFVVKPAPSFLSTKAPLFAPPLKTMT